MTDPTAAKVTDLIARWQKGDRSASDDLFLLVYRELHQIASHFMRHERPGHTLQTTALIHEAYLRLVLAEHQTVRNRRHFFLLAARAMRRILIDKARARLAQKRGGDPIRVEFVDLLLPSHDSNEVLLALDLAITNLESLDARKAKVAELRLFGGINNDEIAGILDVSSRTIERDWRIVRAWLQDEVGPF